MTTKEQELLNEAVYVLTTEPNPSDNITFEQLLSIRLHAARIVLAQVDQEARDLQVQLESQCNSLVN